MIFIILSLEKELIWWC